MEDSDFLSVIPKIKSREEPEPKNVNDFLSDSPRERVELDGRKGFFKLRWIWSVCIVSWISFLIVSHTIIALLIGARKLDFTGNEWLISIIIAENFLQIVGMGYVVVKFLYKSIITH